MDVPAQELGFGILATRGTAAHLTAAGVGNVEEVLKIQEGRPNAADLMKNKDIQMMMITSTGNEPDVRDGKNLRRLSLALKVGPLPASSAAKAVQCLWTPLFSTALVPLCMCMCVVQCLAVMNVI